MADETNQNSGNPTSGEPQPDAMAEAALKATQQAIAGLADGLGISSGGAQPSAAGTVPAGSAVAPTPSGAKAPELPNFAGELTEQQQRTIELLSDVTLNVKIELGRTRMLIEDVLKLAEGAVVELDKLAGDPVDIYVNDRPIARGEVLVLNDNFCVRVNEILATTAEPNGKTAKPA
jgi:flagellar motor switch protein FliN/FliY